MIVGKGQIASSFLSQSDEWDDCIVFASGVSDSSNTDLSNFDREIELLKHYLSLSKPVIYFSTTSFFDSGYSRLAYLNHKVNAERLVLERSENLVLRLPNVVGKHGNPKTLVNFLVQSVKNKIFFTANVNQIRFLVDVEWIPMAARALLSGKIRCANLAINNGISVGRLIVEVEHLLGTKANCEITLNFDHFSIPVAGEVRTLLEKVGLPVGTNYERQLLTKYFVE